MPYISLHYKLITTIYDPPSSSYQCSNFSSMIKDKQDNWISIYINDRGSFYKSQLIEQIKKAACIPICTIVEIYTYYRTYVEEYRNYIKAFNYLDERYSHNGDNTIYYAYVDLNKDSVFNNINNTQLQSESNKKYLENQVSNLNRTISNLNSENYKSNCKIYDLKAQNNELKKKQENIKKEMTEKNSELQRNLNYLENKYNNLQTNHQLQIKYLNKENYNLKIKIEEEKNQMNEKNQRLEKNIKTLEAQNKSMEIQYENLKTENQARKNEFNSLTVEHNNLKKKQQEEENKKMEKRKNLENYRITFKKDEEVIKNNNIQVSKSYITIFIINEFAKGFEKSAKDKDNFTKSLTNYMSKFSEEFMSYCKPFMKSFNEHSKRIISEYKVNESKLSIEHINFIVIGKAGFGKSTFINECLLLNGIKKAKEGKGTSVTDKSTLYSSEKLKQVRMWDTQGLDYKINQSYILNEIKRLVEEGLKKGPDHYINIILYCTKGDRFQEEDGQLVNEIMKLYPMDNLPVIITQLQAYFKDDAIEMENTIREILLNYLEHKIVKKIEIASIVSRDKIVEDKIYKARGIPELLRTSFDLMGRAITSATFKKFSQDIEDLCKNFVEKKIDYLKNKTKDEMEVLDISRDYYMDDSEKYFYKEEKPRKNLPPMNFYSKMTDKNYFMINFVKVMTAKFLDIFNNLNNTNYTIEDKDKSLVLIFIEERLQKLKNILDEVSKNIFEQKIYEKIYQKYFTDLRKQQSKRSKEFKTTNQIIDEAEIEKNFKEELFNFFRNEFYKYFFCIIIKLYFDNLKNILIENYEKELKENEAMTKIINEKAENSLKFVTQHLKEKLLNDLEKYFPKEEKKIENGFNDFKNNINFDY